MYTIMTELSKFIPAHGWRRTGTLNIILILCYGVILVVCLAISVSRPGSTFLSATIIFEGDCKTSNTINIILHLLLNLLSTLILASSGFFMQILSSPSRKEIDRAHSQARSIEIGAHSMRNLRFLSPIKAFATGEVAFFPPGASLANAGTPSYGWDDLQASGDNECSEYEYYYGENVPLTEYWDTSSLAYKNITNTATESRNWYNITAKDCLAEYSPCNPRTQFRDVVIVVDTDLNGWTRSQVFEDTHDELGPDWDSHVPRDNANSLWYSTHCAVNLPTSPVHYGLGVLGCNNYCAFALGFSLEEMLTNTPAPSESNWTLTFNNPEISDCNAAQDRSLGYNTTFNEFNVKYCLAEPSPDHTCRVGLSNLLFFITIICIFLKAATCTLALFYIPYTSLVTLGDALESFITEPDPVTLGLATFEIRDSHRLQFQPYQALTPGSDIELIDKIHPRAWHRKSNRLASALPRSVWSSTYLPVLFFIGIGAYFASMVYKDNGLSFNGAFGESNLPFFINDFVGQYGYFATLLIANLPQFILSYCFFPYTSLFTRMLIEMEFNSYSTAIPKPLRVSYPAGDQVSTYWLQIRYLYSVPLLIINALLHWLASNSVFLFTSQGGYLEDYYYDTLLDKNDDWGVFEGALVILGISPPAALTFILVSFVLAFIPLLYAFRKLPGDMVVGACDSLVLSAACHPYVTSSAPEEIPHVRTYSHDVMDEVSEQAALRRLSRGKLRWGVVSIPPELANVISAEQDAMHLSFGGMEEYLYKPPAGNLYG